MVIVRGPHLRSSSDDGSRVSQASMERSSTSTDAIMTHLYCRSTGNKNGYTSSSSTDLRSQSEDQIPGRRAGAVAARCAALARTCWVLAPLTSACERRRVDTGQGWPAAAAGHGRARTRCCCWAWTREPSILTCSTRWPRSARPAAELPPALVVVLLLGGLLLLLLRPPPPPR